MAIRSVPARHKVADFSCVFLPSRQRFFPLFFLIRQECPSACPNPPPDKEPNPRKGTKNFEQTGCYGRKGHTGPSQDGLLRQTGRTILQGFDRSDRRHGRDGFFCFVPRDKIACSRGLRRGQREPSRPLGHGNFGRLGFGCLIGLFLRVKVHKLHRRQLILPALRWNQDQILHHGPAKDFRSIEFFP